MAMGTQLLLCWLGMTDLNAASGKADVGFGPVGQAVAERRYKEVVLLNNWGKPTAGNYLTWLQEQTSSILSIGNRPLKMQQKHNI